jgi:hypothetical protein
MRVSTPSVTTSTRVQAHAVTDRLADILPQQKGHARSDGSRRQAPRLEHDDAWGTEQFALQQGQRNQRALAGPGWRLQHGVAVRLERGVQRHGQRMLPQLLDRCGIIWQTVP